MRTTTNTMLVDSLRQSLDLRMRISSYLKDVHRTGGVSDERLGLLGGHGLREASTLWRKGSQKDGEAA